MVLTRSLFSPHFQWTGNTKLFLSPHNVFLLLDLGKSDLFPAVLVSDTPAIDCGAIGAQIIISQKSGVCDAYGAKTDGRMGYGKFNF